MSPRYINLKIFTCFLFVFQSISNAFSFSDIKFENNTNLEFKISKDLLLNKQVKIDTGWQFYWKKFLDPNSINNQEPLGIVTLESWTNYTDKNKKKLPAFGYATYKINFSIPKEMPNVSLYLPRIIGAYKIWINGDFILETGRVGKSKTTTLHRRFTKIIPLNSDETNFEVILQVANFYNKKAGITEPIILGTTDEVFYKNSLQIMTDMVTVGSFSFVGILFLLFYLLYWNKDKAVLYFSIMCIALSYHTLNDRYAPLTKIFEEISWVFLTKIEYLASYIVGYFASLFFSLILKEYIHKWYTKLVLYYTLVLVIAVILLPSPYFTELILFFLVFMLFNIVYIFFTTIKAIIAKSKASTLLLIGIVLASTMFLANILFFINGDEIKLIYVKFGYILVFLLISMLLLRRFSNSFYKLELANELAIAQKREIAKKSKELFKVNSKLEKNLNLLKSNNEELEDFNHIVSHDLKSPLISIYSLATFLEEDLKLVIDQDSKKNLDMLKDIVQKMENSINSLLEYSKVTKSNKQKEYFNINDLLKKVISLIIFNKNDQINFPKNDITVYANKIELEHVFQNLISNSVKFNNKERVVITIESEVKEDEYIFSVSDNGSGIDPKYHTKIFKIFKQLDVNNKDLKSSGVGLAIVKKIVSKNNGEISVDSKKDKGLKISFTWKI